MNHKILIILLCLLTGKAFSQEVFHDLEINKIFQNTEKWKIDAAMNWKHIYDEVGWRRWGASGMVTQKMGIFGLRAGLMAFYTFDKDIVNHWELRLWLGVQLKNKIADQLYLIQEVRGEWRNIFYADNQYKGNIRTRYKVGLEYEFPENEEAKTKGWGLATEAEWYFIKDKDIASERFNNTREISFIATKGISEKTILGFGYKFETLNKNIYSHTENGHNIVVFLRL